MSVKVYTMIMNSFFPGFVKFLELSYGFMILHQLTSNSLVDFISPLNKCTLYWFLCYSHFKNMISAHLGKDSETHHQSSHK